MSTRDEAEALIADGYRVWPVSRATLRPTRAGFARADGPDVCASAEEFTDATEVGVLCGPCPAAGPGARYVCVDYDGPTEHRVGGAPTLTSKGGAHEWYRVPPGVTGFRQSQGVRRGGGWAIDTRDYGGYARETKDGEALWDDDVPSHPRDITQAEVDALFGAPAPASAPATAWVAPTVRTVPSPTSVASFVHRIVSNPDGTNQAFGAVGAVLAAWGWGQEDIRAALTAWFAGTGGVLPGRHLASALAAADTRRAGGVVPGFPRLAELGVAWAEERPSELDISALMLEATAVPHLVGTTPTTASASAPPFYFRTAREMRDQVLPDIQWVCEALSLAPGAPAICVGYSGVGKTTMLQDLALSVATEGRRFLSTYEVRHGAVAHVDLEQGEQQTIRTYRALGLTGDEPLVCSVLPTWRLTDAANLEALARAAVGRTLVIIDSFRAACPDGDENASEYAAPMGVLGRISEATGCTIILNHHSGKNNQDRVKGARGTSAITAACSVHWSFEREDLAPATRPCLQLVKSRNHATDAMVWETYVEKIGTAEAFSLHARANAGVEAEDVELQNTIVSVLRAAPRSPNSIDSIRNIGELAKAVGRQKQAVTEAARALGVVPQNGILVVP